MNHGELQHTERQTDFQAEDSLLPRSRTHKRDKITINRIVILTLSSLKPVHSRKTAQKRFRTPEEWPTSSRYGAKRRAKRIKKRSRLLAIKFSIRAEIALISVIIILSLAFWAKFAVVYNLPTFLQSGPLQNAQAYIVYKAWWFGPPSFNLGKYQNIDPENPKVSLILQLERYQDIITNPNEIVYVFPRNSNNSTN